MSRVKHKPHPAPTPGVRVKARVYSCFGGEKTAKGRKNNTMQKEHTTTNMLHVQTFSHDF